MEDSIQQSRLVQADPRYTAAAAGQQVGNPVARPSASLSHYGVFQPGGLQQLAQESRKIGARRQVRPQQSSYPAAVSPVGRAFGRNHQPFLLPVCGRDGARHSVHE